MIEKPKKNNLKSIKHLKIIKWNIYIADVPFLEIQGSKLRPVIALVKVGIATIIIPLTTNLSKQTDTDIAVSFNGTNGLIKISNIQRINNRNLKSPYYSIDKHKIIKVESALKKQIIKKTNELFFNLLTNYKVRHIHSGLIHLLKIRHINQCWYYHCTILV